VEKGELSRGAARGGNEKGFSAENNAVRSNNVAAQLNEDLFFPCNVFVIKVSLLAQLCQVYIVRVWLCFRVLCFN